MGDLDYKRRSAILFKLEARSLNEAGFQTDKQEAIQEEDLEALRDLLSEINNWEENETLNSRIPSFPGTRNDVNSLDEHPYELTSVDAPSYGLASLDDNPCSPLDESACDEEVKLRSVSVIDLPRHQGGRVDRNSLRNLIRKSECDFLKVRIPSDLDVTAISDEEIFSPRKPRTQTMTEYFV